MTDQDPCDSQNFIRSCSSSSARAQSWSSGVGRQTDHASTNQSSLSDYSREYLLTTNPFHQLSIKIPTVYLVRGKSALQPSSSSIARSTSSTYHTYQLDLQTNDGKAWSVYRRYSQFHLLNHSLKSKDTEIGKFKFPPKRRINSKASTIVQERRTKLEEYMKCLISYMAGKPTNEIDEPYQQLRDLIGDRSRSVSGPRDTSPSGRSSLTDSACSDPSSGVEINDRQTRTSSRFITSSQRVMRSDVHIDDQLNTAALLKDFLGLKEKLTENLEAGE